MTYFITALTNDKAQLIVSTTQTTSLAVAVAVKAMLESDGNIVLFRSES